MTRITYWLGLLAVAAIALAGCGGGDETTSAQPVTSEKATGDTNAEKQAAEPKKGAWGVVFGAEGEHGIILYDLSGHTLYTFENDKGGTSSCYGACAKTWPPALTEGKPRAEGEVSANKVGTTKRKDGTIQLTYAGHPLYRYSRDRSADVNGNGIESFGGTWYAIRPNGERL